MDTTFTKKSPLKFFLIVYALSIPIWIIERFVNIKGLPLDIPIMEIFAAFTPLVTACILVRKEEGKAAVIKLLQRIFDFSRIRKKRWYMVIILLPFLIYFLIFVALQWMRLPLPINLHIPIQTTPLLFLFFFIGAIAEEVGYMGYAVDPIQQRWNALSTTLLIGLPWAIWHYPSIIKQGHDAIWIAWGTIGTIAVRVLIVWIYNNTAKSLFACILFHTLFNVGRVLFPKDATHNPLVDYPAVHYLVIAIIAFVVIFVWGSKTLARYRFNKIESK